MLKSGPEERQIQWVKRRKKLCIGIARSCASREPIGRLIVIIMHQPFKWQGQNMWIWNRNFFRFWLFFSAQNDTIFDWNYYLLMAHKPTLSQTWLRRFSIVFPLLPSVVIAAAAADAPTLAWSAIWKSCHLFCSVHLFSFHAEIFAHANGIARNWICDMQCKFMNTWSHFNLFLERNFVSIVNLLFKRQNHAISIGVDFFNEVELFAFWGKKNFILFLNAPN